MFAWSRPCTTNSIVALGTPHPGIWLAAGFQVAGFTLSDHARNVRSIASLPKNKSHSNKARGLFIYPVIIIFRCRPARSAFLTIRAYHRIGFTRLRSILLAIRMAWPEAGPDMRLDQRVNSTIWIIVSRSRKIANDMPIDGYL